jgi:hypothetical protein
VGGWAECKVEWVGEWITEWVTDSGWMTKWVGIRWRVGG